MADVRDVKGLIDTTKSNEERREQRTVIVTKVSSYLFICIQLLNFAEVSIVYV
jgi:hypothetical protein